MNKSIIEITILTWMLLHPMAFCYGQETVTLRSRSNVLQVDYSTLSPNQKKDEASVVKTELRVSVPPVYHALIIGVSDYQFAGPQLPKLDHPVTDALRLKEILVSNYLFTDENTTVLSNPTREVMINSLDEMLRKVGDRDNLLIFYAGHGYYDSKTDFGYWLPADAKVNSSANWIDNSQIKNYISAIRSKHTLLISDACFAGSIFKSRSTNLVDRRKVSEIYRSKSRKAITSGNLTQVPDESFFLKILLKTLSENEDDFLPASILFNRIYEPIFNNSVNVPQFAPIYGAGDEGGDFIFIKR